MSSRTSDIPERVFTWCALPLRYNDQYIRHDNPWVALLFVDRSGALNHLDLEHLMKDDIVKEIMENFFMAGPVRWDQHERLSWWSRGDPLPDPFSGTTNHGILVSQRPLYMPDCRRHPDTPLWVSVDGVIHKATVYDMYTRCRRLHRLMGCWRCPDVGESCFVAHRQIPWPQMPLPGMGNPFIDLNDETLQGHLQSQQMTWFCAKDWFKPYKDTIKGFTYIPPQLACSTPTRPGENVNQPYQLDFNGLEEAREDLNKRSRAGIETRRVKREECPRCYFKHCSPQVMNACDRYRPRNCQHGAWTEEQALDATLPPFEAGLKEAGYTMRDFERILAVAGKKFRRPTENGGHASWIVSRLSFEVRAHNPCRHRAKILIKRTAAEYRGVWEYLDTMQDLWRLLPDDLRRTLDEAPSLKEVPEILAVAAHMNSCHTVRPYICTAGCFREVSPDISHIAVPQHPYRLQVEVGYWVRSYWRTFEFGSLEEVCSYFKGSMPGFSLSRHTEDQQFKFNVWPRPSGIWG